MAIHRMITLTAGAIAALSLVGATTQVADASSSRGEIRVHLLAEGQAQKGIRLCATTKSAPKKSVVKGNCHKTNSHGYATLTSVPKGHWFVTTFNGSTPAQSSLHKVKVSNGKTTKYTFNEQVG